MAAGDGLGRRLDAALARHVGRDLPEPEGLPRVVSPLPVWLENVGLRLAWLVIAVNLAGTAFGFWYYESQLARTAAVMWPFVPDSPTATLLIACSLAAWRLDLRLEWLHVLAFFGCVKLGMWTPIVQVFVEPRGAVDPWLWHFLVWSHLAMVVQAFVVHRYAAFTVRAVAIATVYYTVNDVVSYFVPVVGDPHHTRLNAEWVGGATRYTHDVAAHDQAAAAAVVLTIACVFLALRTRLAKERARRRSGP